MREFDSCDAGKNIHIEETGCNCAAQKGADCETLTLQKPTRYTRQRAPADRIRSGDASATETIHLCPRPGKQQLCRV